MSYKLFIDDERFPVNPGFIIARNMREVLATLLEYGTPHFIMFDHDLGENEPSGFDIAKMLVEMDMDGKITLGPDFSFVVHSMNPVGAQNIKTYLENYLKVKRNV